MTKLLKVEGVRKGFPGVQALGGVSFELDAGEVMALVGENGAGKSTLMKILSGVYTMDEGLIEIDGSPVSIQGTKSAQDLGISIIHQELNLMPHLTVAQNIFIGRENAVGPFLKDRALAKRAQTLLDADGIRLDANARVGNLTVAQQQMVEIAKALSFNKTRILIMDEPTSALSEAETETLFKLIGDLKSKGVGIVYISHRMEELRKVADGVTVLRDGKYVGTARLTDISDRQIVSMMVGREIPADARPARPGPGPDAPIVLKVENLSTLTLLRDVHFDLRQGEILGFAGLMGAGRTETARAVIGADPKTSGEIQVNGKAVSIGSPDKAVALGIGYLPEDRKRHGLLLSQNVNFNLVLPSLRGIARALGFVDDRRGRTRSSESIDALRIKTPTMFTFARNLSGGNQQKIVIGKWLMRDCDILIFDEPTRGIDVGAKEEIYRLLTSMAGKGKSIIVISSELPEILRLSDRVVVFSQGRVTGELDNAEADQEKIMELATVGITSSEGIH